MARRTPGTPDPNPPDPAYVAAFEAERARVLRRRIVLCISILLGLLSLSIFGTYLEYQEYAEGLPTPLEVVVLGGLDDLAIGSLLLATLLFVLRGKPNRRRLVQAISVATVAIMAAATYFEIRRVMLHPTDFWGDPLVGVDARLIAYRFALFTHALLVLTPLMVVPMRWTESRLIVAACCLIYSLLIAVEGGAPLKWGIGYSVLAVLLTIPAIAFSHWRYQRFDAQFQHQDLKGRFGELSAELMQARRLHEALFPKPLDDGPVRVSFVYEPMREIGGDFLFLHASPSQGVGAPPHVYVVLIDVSGHGVASALAVNRLHGELVRLCAAADPSGTPLTAAQVITNLNAYVHASLAPQGVFATAVCLKMRPGASGADATLEWCGAGHPPALLRSRSGEVLALDSTAAMLGVLEPAEYHAGAQSVSLLPGDVLLAYTDGLLEARDAEGREFGAERVRGVLRAHAAGHRLIDTLVDTVARHRAGRAADDTLVVEVAVAANVPAASAPPSAVSA